MQRQALQYRYQKAIENTKLANPVSYDDLRILDKRQQLAPLELNPMQRQLIANLSGRDLILKARQMGSSTAVQAWMHVQAWRGTITGVTLAHDMETGTKRFRAMARRFWENLPDDKKPQRITFSETEARYLPMDSTIFIGTAGSAQGGRGGTYSHFHGSEVAFWKNDADIIAGVLQGVPIGYGHIIMESTAYGEQGWFYEQCMRALDGDTTWRLHFFPWWVDPEYRVAITKPLVLTDDEQRLAVEHDLDHEQIAFRRAKQFELGDDFNREYAEDPRAAFAASIRGLVYPNFSDANVTTGAEYNPALDVYWGIDDGYAYGAGRGSLGYHPRVILFAQVAADGGLHIFDEYVATQELSERSIANARAKDYKPPLFAMIDSSAAELHGRLWESGVQTVGATHTVVEGIKNLRRLVCDPAGVRLLRIHPRCQELIYEMTHYRNQEEGIAVIGEPKPIKKDDHAADAARYLAWYLARYQP